MMSSRHLGQYKRNFYIMDEVIANLPSTKASVARMCFQIVSFPYCYIFKLNHFGLHFHSRLHRFHVNRR